MIKGFERDIGIETDMKYFILAKELHIPPKEADKLPAETVERLLAIWEVVKEEEMRELRRNG